MNVLESPLEALAFDYLSVGLLTAVNNLWTWVAVITAAVSFWMIRAAAGATSGSCLKSESPPPPTRNDETSSGSQQPAPESSVADSADEPPATPASSPASAPSGFAVEDVKVDGVTKGMKFFTVYNEVGSGEGDGEWNECEESGGEDGGCGEWWESWERVLKMKMGKVEGMGWYRYQDLTEINGNVVRLWDGYRRELKCSSSCVVW